MAIPYSGPSASEYDERMAAYKRAYARLDDAEKLAIDDLCKRIMKEYSGYKCGPATAFEIASALGVLFAEGYEDKERT